MRGRGGRGGGSRGEVESQETDGKGPNYQAALTRQISTDYCDRHCGQRPEHNLDSA